MTKGTWQAVGAYVAWGLLPLYWKQIEQVPVLQLIAHRILWSVLTLIALIVLTSRGRSWRHSRPSRRALLTYALSAVLITINWVTYVWGVNNGFIVETSLGYFVNPLVSVMFGVLLLHEQLRVFQWVAIGLATAGVAYLTFVHGSLPWIALILAFSFGSYGLMKKTAPLGSIDGLTLETGLLLLPALAYLVLMDRTGRGVFLHTSTASDVLLVAAGPVTTVPLLLFASAAPRIPLSLMGVLQYIAPSLQFLLGVLLYREPFSPIQLVGYGLVWAAVVVFSVEGLRAAPPRKH
jgi:chloramphenicol-sensitive protein RarD